MTNVNDKAYISIKEGVTLTGVSEFSLRRMIANREIAYIECGKKYLLNRARLLAHLEAVSEANVRR